ncbi:MAG: PHP domain-containing protein [Firmicutes bacterium]|nr:PHP domain-containing protein [Bacillota bacterium]
MNKIKGDYHTHSEYSHGNGDLVANIESAINKGLTEIGITDHGPQTFNFVRLGVKDAEELIEIKERIEVLNKLYPEIRVLAGTEANIINEEGDLDVPDYILEELDIVAAGMHLLILPQSIETALRLVFDNRFMYRFFPGKRARIREWNTRAVINAVKRHQIDFITHPGYKLDIDTYKLARVCTQEGTCLEINARHGLLTEGFVRAAMETDVRFVINSDAHLPASVGKLEPALKIVKDLGISNDRIINYQGFTGRHT